MSNSPLPTYERPPVLEVILGVQFDRLPKFTNAHLGAFWTTLDSNTWPHVTDAPPIPPQFERFEQSTGWARGVRLQLSNDATSRLLIKNAAGDNMIQLQNGRLHMNWIGIEGSSYPRFDAVANELQRAWLGFESFAAKSEIGKLQPNQWEVTYINHIRIGTVWRSPAEWDFFKLLAAQPSIDGLISAESFSGEWHFVIPNNRGRLHVAWHHGKDESPEVAGKETVVLTLTARGPMEPGNDSAKQIAAGLELGHVAVVTAFSSFMNERANHYWGLKDAAN